MKVDFVFDEGSKKEDLYFIEDNIFGVVDGFNSLARFTDKNRKTGGLIAASITRDEFLKNDKDLRTLAIRANQKIKDRMLVLNIDINDKNCLWGTAIAVVRVKDNSFEWAQMGDSLILVIYKDNSFRLLVRDYDHDKEVLSQWKELAEQKRENIREIIGKEALVKLRNKMNKTYGFLTGEEKAISFLKSGKEELKNIKHILLFTDGLIIPKKDPLKEDDWKKFVKLFLEGGLNNIKNFVRSLEKNDPKCWKYPRYKQYDDIAAISISF
jgi:serine/threonine protein phosphatase PrpC